MGLAKMQSASKAKKNPIEFWMLKNFTTLLSVPKSVWKTLIIDWDHIGLNYVHDCIQLDHEAQGG